MRVYVVLCASRSILYLNIKRFIIYSKSIKIIEFDFLLILERYLYICSLGHTQSRKLKK